MSAVVWVIIVVVVLGVVVALFGWDRYRQRPPKGGPALRSTDEVFVDPDTGRRMRVWFDPSTGRREYRPE